MNKIVSKEQYSEKVFCIVVEAPLIAHSCRPGQFIIVRVDNNSERVPYTIAKADDKAGTLTLVIQEVGLSSKKYASSLLVTTFRILLVLWVILLQ